MRYIPFILCVLLVSTAVSAASVDGLVTLESPHSATQTIDRFEKIASDKGLTIFDRIDHAAGAKKVDMELRPTTVLIFGNPKGGTPLMQCAQTIGIDLPLKALAWTDDQGQTWFAYNDPAYIAERHGAPDCPAVKPVSKALSGLADAAVAP